MAALPTRGLRSILVLVRDVSSSVDFFTTQGLGLKLMPSPAAAAASPAETLRGATLVPDARRDSLLGGPPTTLVLRAAKAEAEATHGYSPILCFEVEDLDTLLPELLMKGARLDGAIAYEPLMKACVVKTPDGLTVGLTQHDPVFEELNSN